MSKLTKAVRDYIQLRRSLGYKMRAALPLLLDFVSFLDERKVDRITIPLALEWARQNPNAQPAHWAQRLTNVRRFACYWSAIDPRTEIPPRSLLPHHPKRARPHLYTDKEIRQLLERAQAIGGLHGQTYHCLLGLLAVSGLRISEALNLRPDEVDLDQGVLVVRGTKFGKTRLVPLHASTIKALRSYVRQRDRFFKLGLPRFFVTRMGNPIDGSLVRRAFYKLSRQIGLRGAQASHGPRLHDFRHRFAVETLVRWYRAGGDVERRLPALSTYLGHVHVRDTYWYLTICPELMGLAVKRLERHLGVGL